MTTISDTYGEAPINSELYAQSNQSLNVHYADSDNTVNFEGNQGDDNFNIIGYQKMQTVNVNGLVGWDHLNLYVNDSDQIESAKQRIEQQIRNGEIKNIEKIRLSVHIPDQGQGSTPLPPGYQIWYLDVNSRKWTNTLSLQDASAQ